MLKTTTIVLLACGLCGASTAAQQDGLPATERRSVFDEGQVEHLASLSSPGFEAKPDISNDLLTLFFASTQAPNLGELDLFAATRSAPGAPFGTQQNITELNSSGRDHTPTTNADLTFMIFSSSRAGGVGSDDAWASSRPDASSTWGAPVNLAVLNSTERDMGFTMTPDALNLYFSSNRGKPQGALDPDFDLYVSTRPDMASAWSVPVPVVELNTIPFADKFPSVSGDHLALYFASNRPGSVLNDLLEPSQDTWVALRPDTASPWSIVENVFEYNTKHNEYLMSVADDHSEMFFVSDRPGGLGGFDLYRTPAIPGVTRHGAGTQGVFGTPRLRPIGGKPAPGNLGFGLEISQVPPGTVGFVFVSPDLGAGPLLVDLSPGNFARFAFLVGGSAVIMATPLPPFPGLIGHAFYLQALVLDPAGAGTIGGGIPFSATPGNEIVIQTP